MSLAERLEEPANKSRIFSAGAEKCQMCESLRREWRALCKQADKADGLFSARPAGLAALNSLGVGAFRRATSPPVIAALMLPAFYTRVL